MRSRYEGPSRGGVQDASAVPRVAGRRAVALDHLDHVAPAVRLRAAEVGEAVHAGELAARERPAVPARDLRVARERRDGAADVARGLRDAEVRRALARIAPVALLDAVVLEHRLRAHPAGCERDG